MYVVYNLKILPVILVCLILHCFLDKPRIDVGAVKDIVVKAGEEFSITVPFTGFPKPEATWTKNDKDIDEKDTRIFVKVCNMS